MLNPCAEILSEFMITADNLNRTKNWKELLKDSHDILQYLQVYTELFHNEQGVRRLCVTNFIKQLPFLRLHRALRHALLCCENQTRFTVQYAANQHTFKQAYDRYFVYLEIGMTYSQAIVRRLMSMVSDDLYGRQEHKNAIFANIVTDIAPWQPWVIRPEWLLVNHSTVRHMTKEIVASRDFQDVPVLADALEDAGCEDYEILNHLRNDKHYYGCALLHKML